MTPTGLKLDLFEAPECSGLPGQLVLKGPGQGRAGQDRALTAGRTGAVDRGHPQVGGASVEDDREILRGCSDADGAKVLHLAGWGQHGSLTGGSPACLPQDSLWVVPLAHLLSVPSLFFLPFSPCPIHPSFKASLISLPPESLP